jgi:hypothetical protein
VDTHSPIKLKKFKKRVVCQKADGNVFWNRKGVLMVEFIQQRTTIISEVYCETLKKHS